MENFAEAPQREGEQRRSEAEEGEVLGPDDVDPGARQTLSPVRAGQPYQ